MGKLKLGVLEIIVGCGLLLGPTGCDRTNPTSPACPPFSIVPDSPYGDPIWNPTGMVIGFNHRPIKEIKYIHGYDCPNQAIYIYDDDSTGFWLIDSAGNNMRRVLPYTLNSPAWSSDGTQIAFSSGGQIFRMPFDGEKFDTTGIQQLTFIGRNFSPSWSPDDGTIAYDNTDCGSATTPIPPNSCGILVMDTTGNEQTLIGETFRSPYWSNDGEFVYSYGSKFNLATMERTDFFDPSSNNVAFYYPTDFNPTGTEIAFIGYFTNTSTQFLKLFGISSEGKNLRTISERNIVSFSWSPTGRLVYLYFDHTRIDQEKGTLWTMDASGQNHRQLTFNNPTIETN